MRFKGFTLDQISRWPLGQALAFFKDLALDADEQHIAGDLLREVRDRLTFLVDVGLDYLSLARGTPTLSGGESQRIRLASQIGSGLTGVLYVLDEPTIGLHPRDNARLLGGAAAPARPGQHPGSGRARPRGHRGGRSPRRLRARLGRRGRRDHGGRHAREGQVVGQVADRRLLERQGRDPRADQRRPAGADRRSAGDRDQGRAAAQPQEPRRSDSRCGVVTAVTGVSGSGKSSLVEDILWKAAARALHRAQLTPGAHEAIEGLEHINKVISVDQSPLGSTPNSTPATYSGAFDLIRELFAKLPEAKVRGYSARRFSFNQAGGRCEACDGAGQKRIEMHFLPDVWITCEACGGARYTAETLAVTFHGKTIADVLEHVGRRCARAVRQRAADPADSHRHWTTSGWAISRSARRHRRSPAAKPSA